MNIRLAELADAEGISRLLEELGYPRTTAEVGKQISALTPLPDNAIAVAECRDGLAGCVEVYETETLLAGRRAELGVLLVSQTFRRKGIAKVLTKFAIDWARGRGIKVLRVGTGTERADAHAFYEQLGFTKVREHYIYQKKISAIDDL